MNGENEEKKDIFAGLSVGQVKKLKLKLKADKEAAEKAGTTVESVEAKPEAAKTPVVASKEEDKEDGEGAGNQFAGLSVGQVKKLKAKLKAEADAVAKATGPVI